MKDQFITKGVLAFAIVFWLGVLSLVVAACKEDPMVPVYPYTYVVADVELHFQTEEHMLEFIEWSKTWGYPCDNLDHFKLPKE